MAALKSNSCTSGSNLTTVNLNLFFSNCKLIAIAKKLTHFYQVKCKFGDRSEPKLFVTRASYFMQTLNTEMVIKLFRTNTFFFKNTQMCSIFMNMSIPNELHFFKIVCNNNVLAVTYHLLLKLQIMCYI